jgi:cardiolipin synthase
VSVRLLLPEKSDVRITQYASRALYHRFLKRGVEMHLWRPTVLHAKTAVVDEIWTTVGSSNLDAMSLNHNLESNFVIIDAELGAELQGRFERDLRFSKKIELEEWQRRGWISRILERFAFAFRAWL